MYTVLFESIAKKEWQVVAEDGKWKINGVEASIDIQQINPNYFNLIVDGKSINLEVLDQNSNGTHSFKVNGKKVNAELRTALDELLNKMGMNKSELASVKELKAPMPGLILEIMIQEGTSIKKGDPILILEAMKMENVIKSPIDGVVKKLNVKEKDSVAKNQVLIEF